MDEMEMINKLVALTQSGNYSGLEELYKREDNRLLRQLRGAMTSEELFTLKGKAIMLERLKTLPESEVNKKISEGQ